MTSSLKIKGVGATLANIKAQIALTRETKEAAVKASLVESLKDATPIDTGAARDSWKLSEDGSKIVSDCEYMDRLNSGSSKQAPAHFIEQTILENNDVIVHGSIIESSV